MAKWTIGSYSRFIKTIRKQDGRLTVPQARLVYKQMRSELGRPVFAGDVKKHPRIRNIAIGGVLEEGDKAQLVLWHFIERRDQRSEALEILFQRHYGQEGYSFDLDNNILKVSISTTKTRKKFSVRR